MATLADPPVKEAAVAQGCPAAATAAAEPAAAHGCCPAPRIPATHCLVGASQPGAWHTPPPQSQQQLRGSKAGLRELFPSPCSQVLPSPIQKRPTRPAQAHMWLHMDLQQGVSSASVGKCRMTQRLAQTRKKQQ